MRVKAFRWTLATSLIGFACGCSSSPTSTSGPTNTNPDASDLTGIYVTNNDGPIQQFEFVDSSHVNVWWAQCADGQPCEANDTYTRTGSQLVIDDPSGNVTTLELSGLEQGLGESYDPLHTLGSSLGGSDAGGMSLGGGTSLTGDASTLGSGQQITLVITFTITIVFNSPSALAGSSSGSGSSASGTGSGSGTGGGGTTGSGTTGSGTAGSGTSGSSSGSGSAPMGVSLTPCAGVTLTQTFKSANTFPNDKTAFDFFRSKGLSAAQAAGIVGNLDQESGDSPTCYQSPSGCSSAPVSGYPGAGIAQWSQGGRWNTGTDNLAAYAKQQGTSPLAEQTQLGFTWYELSTYSNYGLSSLEQQTTPTGAAGVFASDFEICGTCAQTKRNTYAQNAYNAFSNDPVAGGSDGGMACTPTYGSCSVSSKSGSCIDTGACGSSGGTSTAGKCPGPANIQCCTH